MNGWASAQSGNSRKGGDYFKIGEKEFTDQRYMYAIPFFNTALKYPGKNDSTALLHLAESYWYTKNYDSAKIIYQKFESSFGPQFTTTQRLAELSANQKDYSKAINDYKKLLGEVPLRYSSLLNERLAGFSRADEYKTDSLDYSVKLLKLNTKQQDFSPYFFGNGLVFVSSRYTKNTAEKEFGWDGLPFSSIYWVKDTADLYTVDTISGYNSGNINLAIKANDDFTARTSNDNDIIMLSNKRSDYNGTLHKLDRFSDDLSNKYNYGPLCFNKAGNKVYYTRNTIKAYKRKYNLEICEASFENGSWGNVKVMPFVQIEYDYYHPALNKDESRLYFCSNIPGGLGGSDIYYINLTSDYEKSVPINIDNKINTSGNELFPTFKGDTLYYSSDGLSGLGGMDIFQTSALKGMWKKPLNMGYPINSSYDDFGIIFNDRKTRGYFSSNRLGTDDIYTFGYEPFYLQLKGTVLSRLTQRRLDSTKVLIRTVIDEKPIIDSVVTDFTGNFKFPVKPGRTYSFAFTRNGYNDTAYYIPEMGTQYEFLMDPTLLSQKFKPLPPPELQVIADRDKDSVPDVKDKCPDVKGIKENYGCPDVQARINELAKMVFFKTASAELSPLALKPLNEIADIMAEYPWITLSIEGHTDNVASAPYNLDLSNRRAKSVKTFFIKRGLAENRFSSAGYGLTRPIADNKTVEGRAMNRRVAMKADFHYKYE